MRKLWAPLLAAGALWALAPQARQDEAGYPPPSFFKRPRWQEPRGHKNVFTGMRFGLDTGAWYADWGIRAIDRGITHTIHGDPVLWMAPRVDMDLAWGMTGSARLEVGTSNDLAAKVLSFHVSRPILDLENGSLALVAGPAYGVVESSGFPGDFDATPGIDVGVEADTALGDGWRLRAFGLIRSMHFKYDPTATVSSFTESQIGTTGFLAGIGLSCRF